jgi:hypothetical protein
MESVVEMLELKFFQIEGWESDGQNTSTSLWSDFTVMPMKLHQGRLSFQAH